jgi:hypothetical protein
VLERLAGTLALDATDTARLRLRAAIDRLSDDVDELTQHELDIIEGVGDDMLLLAAKPNAEYRPLIEGLAMGMSPELRQKRSEQIAHVLTRVTHRWRDTRLLSMKEYFREIIEEIERDTLVYVEAINTIDPVRWLQDEREMRYLEANGHARGRGVSISRLFVVDPAITEESLVTVAAVQRRAGIEHLRFICGSRVSKIADRPEDAVLFGGADEKLYIGHSDPDEPARVDFGECISDVQDICRFRQLFSLLFASGDPDVRHFAASRG